jgi:hypothetical protein
MFITTLTRAPLDPVLCQVNALHILKPFKVYFNVGVRAYPSNYLSFKFSHELFCPFPISVMSTFYNLVSLELNLYTSTKVKFITYQVGCCRGDWG